MRSEGGRAESGVRVVVDRLASTALLDAGRAEAVETRSRLVCHLMLGAGGPVASSGFLPVLDLAFAACLPQGILCGALEALIETCGVVGGDSSIPYSWMESGGVGYAEKRRGR